MIILVLFLLLPFLAGLGAEYLVCRLTRRPLWRAVPPVILTALGAGVALYRHSMWASDAPVWTQLLFVPGLPVAFALLGLLAGWRLWRRLWRPRLIWEKKKE